MKTLLLALVLPLTSLTTLAAPHERSPVPDIPPDAESAYYRQHLSLFADPILGSRDGLDPVVAAGERNLDWLKHINSLRPAGDKLSLTSKDTQRGIPMNQPNEYNPTLILAEHAKLKDQLPIEIRRVIYEGAAFTDTPPIAVADYIEWCRKLDRSYQSAGRWRTMAPYLYYLERRRNEDIRGYYFLSRMPNRAEKLRAYDSQPDAEKAQIRDWLVGLCFNDSRANSLEGCQAEVDSRIRNKTDLELYFQQKQRPGELIYNDYFTIPSSGTRDDFRWEALPAGGSKLVAPFRDPLAEDVRHFLQFNIQDEWKFGDWRLDLPFTANAEPHIIFEPGATANVNGLGGDTITMDANQPLTEYDAQWTIRHEFGHVLGLPDCYVEFYVRERNVIINYQLDIENIMCSRRGHVKEVNVNELRRVYGR